MRFRKDPLTALDEMQSLLYEVLLGHIAGCEVADAVNRDDPDVLNRAEKVLNIKCFDRFYHGCRRSVIMTGTTNLERN